MIDGSMKQCCYYSARPSGLVISASLCTSPCSSDYIFISIDHLQSFQEVCQQPQDRRVLVRQAEDGVAPVAHQPADFAGAVAMVDAPALGAGFSGTAPGATTVLIDQELVVRVLVKTVLA